MARSMRACIVPAQRGPVQAPILTIMDLIHLLVVVLLAAIVSSLGIGLFHLSSGKGDSGKMLRALTFRIVLSIALFVLLMVAWRAGLISPHQPVH